MSIQTNQPLVEDRARITSTIAKFWDQISEGWRTIWGPHIHHGFYENDEQLSPLLAQEKLIDKLTSLLSIAPGNHILDAGCGMGGSSLILARKHHAMVSGITLSPEQVAIATQQSRLENVGNVTFKVEDALSLSSFANNTFDIVWSLESCEQFYDKNLFIQQAFRVLKPGGKLMLATWCSSHDEYAGELAAKYKKLCHAFDLPYMPTIAHYRGLLDSNHFIIKEDLDWTHYVAKSWDVGVTLVSAYSFFQLLKLSGWRGWRFAQQIKMMRDGFRQDRVKYGVFVAEKPKENFSEEMRW